LSPGAKMRDGVGHSSTKVCLGHFLLQCGSINQHHIKGGVLLSIIHMHAWDGMACMCKNSARQDT
jgi:hypothetical protein